MGMELGLAAHRQVTQRLVVRYAKATRAEKREILGSPVRGERLAS